MLRGTQQCHLIAVVFSTAAGASQRRQRHRVTDRAVPPTPRSPGGQLDRLGRGGWQSRAPPGKRRQALRASSGAGTQGAEQRRLALLSDHSLVQFSRSVVFVTPWTAACQAPLSVRTCVRCQVAPSMVRCAGLGAGLCGFKSQLVTERRCDLGLSVPVFLLAKWG